MGAEALEAAVFNWAQKRGVDLQQLGIDLHADEGDEGRIVCKCFTLTEPYIRRKIKELNLRTIPEITNAIKAGGACMACHHIPGGLQDLLDETWGGGTRSRELKVLTQITLPDTGPVEARQAARPDAADALALPVRQEGRQGDRRIRAADAPAATAATWKSSTSRTCWSTAAWSAAAPAAAAPARRCGCSSSGR